MVRRNDDDALGRWRDTAFYIAKLPTHLEVFFSPHGGWRYEASHSPGAAAKRPTHRWSDGSL